MDQNDRVTRVQAQDSGEAPIVPKRPDRPMKSVDKLLFEIMGKGYIFEETEAVICFKTREGRVIHKNMGMPRDVMIRFAYEALIDPEIPEELLTDDEQVKDTGYGPMATRPAKERILTRGEAKAASVAGHVGDIVGNRALGAKDE